MTALMMLKAALAWGKTLPRWVWLTVLAGIVVLAGWRGHTQAVARSYARGQAEMAEQARVVVAGYVKAVTPLLAKRDTVVVVTKQIQQVVRGAVTGYQAAKDAIPATEITPTVATALDAADRLAAAASALDAAVTTERVVTERILVLDTAQITALARLHVADSVRIVRLEKRPTRLKATLYALGTGVLGLAIGFGVR